MQRLRTLLEPGPSIGHSLTSHFLQLFERQPGREADGIICVVRTQATEQEFV